MCKLKLFAWFWITALVACSAHAYTECPPVRVNRVWVDVNGSAEIGFESGFVITAVASQGGIKNLIAESTAAMLASKRVVVRLTADGVACSSGGVRADWWGIHVLSE